MTRTKLLWKCLPKDQKPHGHDWTVPGWHHQDGEIKLCKNGFHASPTILDAMRYVDPGFICPVKVKGDHDDSYDKSTWSDMMLVKRYKWTNEMSVELAIYAAELVLPIFEKRYPDDKRPADAIAAAKKWLADPSEENRIAASAAADAAYAAYDAVRDAYVAVEAVVYAAYAAASPAYVAASAAARDAAYAVRAAVEAADAITLKKINTYIKKLLRASGRQL